MPRGRQPRRFCSSAHRGAFHEACRHYGERAFAEGRVTIEQLRHPEIDGATAVDGPPEPKTPSGQGD
jgi:hypothetical protein